MADTIKVTLVKSPIGAVPKHKKTVKAMQIDNCRSEIAWRGSDAIETENLEYAIVEAVVAIHLQCSEDESTTQQLEYQRDGSRGRHT